MERHNAEMRRVANDEKLYTIARRIVGKETAAEWRSECKRIVPLSPRIVPQPCFYTVANAAAGHALLENRELPEPSRTAHAAEVLERADQPIPSTVKRAIVQTPVGSSASASTSSSMPPPLKRKLLREEMLAQTRGPKGKQRRVQEPVTVPVISSSSPTKPRIILVPSTSAVAQTAAANSAIAHRAMMQAHMAAHIAPQTRFQHVPMSVGQASRTYAKAMPSATTTSAAFVASTGTVQPVPQVRTVSVVKPGTSQSSLIIVPNTGRTTSTTSVTVARPPTQPIRARTPPQVVTVRQGTELYRPPVVMHASPINEDGKQRARIKFGNGNVFEIQASGDTIKNLVTNKNLTSSLLQQVVGQMQNKPGNVTFAIPTATVSRPPQQQQPQVSQAQPRVGQVQQQVAQAPPQVVEAQQQPQVAEAVASTSTAATKEDATQE